MVEVLHTADTHLGYRQYHSPERRRDYLQAFEATVDDAIETDVDAVVHAGDLFHDRRPGLPDLQGTIAALRRLDDAGIPFLAVVGNHEAKRDGQWLDLFEDLGLATRLGAEPELVDSVAFYGLDFVPESLRADLEYEFEPGEADYNVLVSHGLFEPFDHGTWDTEAILDASPVAFDAILLGDNHTPGTEQVQDTWVTYSGSTERTSASERQQRGYNLVSFEEDVRIARRTLEAAREFVFVDVELSPGEGTERVLEEVRQHDHEDAVTIVTIEGDGETVTPAPIEELATDRGALVARVNDRRDLPEEDATTDVHFADPDEAVRERVRSMGLSTVARDLDETVRNGDLADSNVRETVRRRVQERLSGGLDAFEPSEPSDGPADLSDSDPADDSSVGEAGTDDGGANTEGGEDGGGTPEEAEDGEPGTVEAEDGGGTPEEPEDGEPGTVEAEDDGPGMAETEDDGPGMDETEDDPGDDRTEETQASMEEYLGGS